MDQLSKESVSVERWLPIPDFDGYEASDLGRIRSWKQLRGAPGPRILKTQPEFGGYPSLGLYSNGVARRRKVSVLVMLAFRGPRPSGMVVRHMDGDVENNHLANLQWGTMTDNMYDAVRHGTHFQARKTHCHVGHPFSGDNLRLSVTVRGTARRCRTCDRESNVRSYAQRLARQGSV